MHRRTDRQTQQTLTGTYRYRHRHTGTHALYSSTHRSSRSCLCSDAKHPNARVNARARLLVSAAYRTATYRPRNNNTPLLHSSLYRYTLQPSFILHLLALRRCLVLFHLELVRPLTFPLCCLGRNFHLAQQRRHPVHEPANGI